jgi:hypothetical protein
MAELEDADGRSQTKRDKFAKLRESDIRALCVTMSNKDGRRTIYRILKTTGWDRASFTGNSETFKNEGKREVGLLLRAELMRHCREHYNLMMNENEEASNG